MRAMLPPATRCRRCHLPCFPRRTPPPRRESARLVGTAEMADRASRIGALSTVLQKMGNALYASPGHHSPAQWVRTTGAMADEIEIFIHVRNRELTDSRWDCSNVHLGSCDLQLGR